jgi:hypothetical protein
MRDPDEGVAPDGTIVTGARRDRVPAPFAPVVADATHLVTAVGADVSLYLYGSVATGQATVGASDVDLLTVGLPVEEARLLSRELSGRWRTVCRGVELASVPDPADLEAEGDRVYGDRVFLRHYCVHLAGPDPADALPAFPADARAARGFNGDVAEHLDRWRTALDAGTPLPGLARRVARKTLLAVVGLVSVHDSTWTTDRARAAARWSQVDPRLAPGLSTLLAWTGLAADASSDEVAGVLEATVRPVVEVFADVIGLW